MLRHNNPHLDTRRLGKYIRQRSEAAETPPAWPGEARWRESLQGRAVELGASRQRGSFPVADYAALLGRPDSDFLDNAYRHLVGRLPDDEERHHDLAQLMAGLPRERLLLRLASRGEHGGDELPGLARGLSRARWMYHPRIGRGVRWLLGALRLDRLRERLDQTARLQDTRYQALLEMLREQGERINALEDEQRRLMADSRRLCQRLDALPADDAPPPSMAPRPSEPAVHAEAAGVTVPSGGRKPPQQDATGQDFYRALEARFRGAPSAITALMREHLPEVHSTVPLAEGLPLLDLGCGRGEWLALLRQEGIAARGVDLNAANIRAGREQGLEVRYQDALAALCDSADASLGMVSAFHLVEHLDHDQLRLLLHEAHRALAPGGRLLLETPNPQNLIVGSCNFYLDPTHVRPLPPDFLVFLAEFAGFEGVAARPLHPVGEQHHLHEESETARRLNHYLYGPQDYALLATRPAALDSQALRTGQEQDA
ncbi:class I SAM-dependent methyltransferase [Halomonas sp. H10-9-1]|uniref:class I SAM-dependent methyltransferase n=1 Tax=Halomonas sp. H10-9-1 TaxID=2950871 RepID=UPI0032DE75CF